jgi:hypothetical protein
MANSPDRKSGISIEDLAADLCATLKAGAGVALGFECPLFVPHPQRPLELTRGRQGEGSRPWCAGAGAGALAVGLTESAWVLSRIHEAVEPEPRLFFSWSEFQRSNSGLFIWEAFVTGSAKGDSHERDAVLAVDAFVASLPDPDSKNIVSEREVFSLIASAALRAGWQSAASLIKEPCLVLSA